jgi:hypothetical protein
MNLINRDNQYYEYTDYWAEFENIDTVIKGRKNYSDLDDRENFKFEIYIENRIRMFAFSVNTTRTSNTLEVHNNRICEFFFNMKDLSNVLTIYIKENYCP